MNMALLLLRAKLKTSSSGSGVCSVIGCRRLRRLIHQSYYYSSVSYPSLFQPQHDHHSPWDTFLPLESPPNQISHNIVQLLRTRKSQAAAQALALTHHDHRVVCSVIWSLRHEWKLAFKAFNTWLSAPQTQNHAAPWDLIIWVLARNSRFPTAWHLIRHMLLQSSINVRRPLLIMIQSYAVANYPRKSIQTFQAMEKFRTSQDSEALYTLLEALCKNGNVEEAEEFMQLNKNLFPLETRSYNIILNGWCNVSVDLVEAKRVWREMCRCCISPDDTSYAHMISCFSKAGNLFNSLRLFDEMKKMGWVPGLDVYNSLIYALSRDNCFKEAFSLVDKMKEAGIRPDSTTYSSMIVPLCEAHKLEKADSILANMVSAEGLSPTAEIYHAFVEVESSEGIAQRLKQMREAGCGPNNHTFLLIINKLLIKSKQPNVALRMWVEMMKYEIVPGCEHYSVMVRGLARCGWLAKAKKFYDYMKLKGFPDDPVIDKLFKEPAAFKKG